MSTTIAEHIPGPWRGRHNGDDPIDGILIEAEADSSFTIALVNCPQEVIYEGTEYRPYTHPETLFANAHLIAAAPEMLEALKDARRILRSMEDLSISDEESDRQLSGTSDVLDRIEVAIAKAEGRPK